MVVVVVVVLCIDSLTTHLFHLSIHLLRCFNAFTLLYIHTTLQATDDQTASLLTPASSYHVVMQEPSSRMLFTHTHTHTQSLFVGVYIEITVVVRSYFVMYLSVYVCACVCACFVVYVVCCCVCAGGVCMHV